MLSRVKRAVVALALLVLFVPVSLAGAVEYGGLGGLPANPDPDNPRTKSIFVYTISPGQSKQDAVSVINNTGEVKTVEIYATDSEIASGGSFACRQKVDPRDSVGSWIVLSQNEVTLQPGTSQIVPFEVKMPDSTSVGEHNGCIVIQEKMPLAEQPGNGVQLSFRSAIRVAITVPGDIVKDIEFTELAVKPEPKKYILAAKLINKGNVSLDTDVQVTVSTWYGRKAYQNGGVYPLLAQKTSTEYNFEFPRPFWGGFYRVKGTAQYNGDPEAQLGATAPKNVQKNAPNRLLFIMPQPQALALEVLVIIAILALIGWLVRRSLARKTIVKKWLSYKVREGDTLVSLARRCRASWKDIAKANKLKAPYELIPGMVIKLPVKAKRR